MRLDPVVAGLTVCLTLASCAVQTTEANPFIISPDTLFARVRTIAVSPVAVDISGISADATVKLEREIERRLEEAGFNVIPAFEYAGIWQYIADETGGFFDTHSGERDDELFRIATARLRRELIERFDANAVLFPELWSGMIPFQYGMAEWDGTYERVYGAGGMSGEVQALSLIVSIEDTGGTELFENGFGLATIEAWHRNEWLLLNLDGVVSDTRLVHKTVNGVLAPLLRALPDTASVHPD